MKTIKTLAAALVVGMVATSLAAPGSGETATKATPIQRPAYFALADASASIDELLARLVEALTTKDVQALNRLRVTEREYLDFVLPGSVKEGEPPQAYDEKSAQFAWGMLNTKSFYAADALMKGYGGKHFTIRDVQYAKGERQYAWFHAYATTVLTLADDAGETQELILGSIAQIDGQYKFVSLLGNK